MESYTSPVHGGRSGSRTGQLERGGTPGSHSSVLAAAGARRVSLPVSRPGSRGATPERLLTLGTRSGSSLGDSEVKGGPRLDTALAFGRPVRIGAHSRSDRATRAASPTKEEQEVDTDRVTQPSVADEWRAGFLSRLLLWYVGRARAADTRWERRSSLRYCTASLDRVWVRTHGVTLSTLSARASC